MSNDKFPTPVCNDVNLVRGAICKDGGASQSNASPGMIDRSLVSHNQPVCPRLNISAVPHPFHSDDTDAHSSGNDSAERESEGHMGRETSTCSSRNGKGSTTETTESKR